MSAAVDLDPTGAAPALLRRRIADHLADPTRRAPVTTADLAVAAPDPVVLPSMTVAVCTRDRAEDLRSCLESLVALDLDVEILVVDNASTTDATAQVVAGFPGVRYVREPRPGLDWARNRAVLEASGDVLAFTDDDVCVTPGWARALARVFATDPTVGVVTGLVVPAEQATEAQRLFEDYGGFAKGHERRWYRVDRVAGEPTCRFHGGGGAFGTGANMAVRRSVIATTGPFDPALDVGTVTNGGGDIEFFVRVLHHGFTLVYEPGAVVRHRHRRTRADLERQLTNHGIGSASALMRQASAWPGERRSVLRIVHWSLRWFAGRTAKVLLGIDRFPLDLVLAETRGFVVGARRYRLARAGAEAVEREHGPQGPWWVADTTVRWRRRRSTPATPSLDGAPAPVVGADGDAPETGPPVAWVGEVDVADPLPALPEAAVASRAELLVRRAGVPIGWVHVPSAHGPLSALRIADAIAARLGPAVLTEAAELPLESVTGLARAAMQGAPSTPRRHRVSVVIATYDRPELLDRCLHALAGHRTRHDVEVVVVDNHPADGRTAAVLAAHPSVVAVAEERRGLSHARNAGIRAATGDVVVMTDDDVVVDDGWLDALVAPFDQDPSIGIVTGNVVPLELATRAQELFEATGGLGRGFVPMVVDRAWLHHHRGAAPTWHLGAAANLAVRRRVLDDPAVGLLAPWLGAGTPAGVGEDTYLFYRALKAGHRLVYEPTAVVRHRHRRDLDALAHQIGAYAAGHVAYHLTTLVADGDGRGLRRVLVDLPRHDLRQLARVALRRPGVDRRIVTAEIRGHLGGVRAYRDARRAAALAAGTP